MLNLYHQKFFFPLMQRRLGNEKVQRLRREVLRAAYGTVLEIGLGSGLNLACYPDQIRSIQAIDVAPWQDIPIPAGMRVDLQIMSAERMAFPQASFDSVVSTFTLCSIPDLDAALKEIYRVLKPRGVFLFIEHVKSPHRCIAAMQEMLNPFYNRLACGCNVNRDMAQRIVANGFSITSSKIALNGLPISGLYFYGAAAKTGVSC